MPYWWLSGVPLPARRPRILALASDHGLSSYDATYLELAASANAVTLFSQL